MVQLKNSTFGKLKALFFQYSFQQLSTRAIQKEIQYTEQSHVPEFFHSH